MSGSKKNSIAFGKSTSQRIYPKQHTFLGGWGWGVSGGVKTSLRILGAVSGFGPRSRATFFLYMDPLTHGGGPGSEIQVPPVATPLWALTIEDLAVFTLDKTV